MTLGGPNLSQRSAGVLLHITSLPGSPYSGDLGSGTTAFVKWLSAARMSWWQMLPINPAGEGFSPYSTTSSFAGEPILVDLKWMADRGWLKPRELKIATSRDGEGPFAALDRSKSARYERLWTAYGRAQDTILKDADFIAFCQREAYWLDDYSLYSTLSTKFATGDWSEWPAEIRDRVPSALAQAMEDHKIGIGFENFVQYAFDCQWNDLKKLCAEHHIGLIGDLPIFVSHHSADVWSNQQYFLLNEAKKPSVVAGCPPDAFSKDGQLWGNALYNWKTLAADGYQWWIRRFKRIYEQFDTVRLDHFIGFYRYWEIDAKAKTARDGVWKPGPGADFFNAVEKSLGHRILIAEDLGAVVPEVRALRDQFGFYGIKVLQFAFDGTQESKNHLPYRSPVEAVIYTGTHDNNTAIGFCEELEEAFTAKRAGSAIRKTEYQNLIHYLGRIDRSIYQHFIRAVMISPANVAIIPMQDLLGNSKTFRMNTPGVAKGNWRYRARLSDIATQKAQWVAKVNELFGRANPFTMINPSLRAKANPSASPTER